MHSCGYAMHRQIKYGPVRDLITTPNCMRKTLLPERVF